MMKPPLHHVVVEGGTCLLYNSSLARCLSSTFTATHASLFCVYQTLTALRGMAFPHDNLYLTAVPLIPHSLTPVLRVQRIEQPLC
jgi:hypothetical protein